MQWLFGSKPVAPETVPTDDIIPLYGFDDSYVGRRFILLTAFRLDAVLSPNKLKGALEKLASSGEWRKIGSRIREVDGKLQYHVPLSFF